MAEYYGKPAVVEEIECGYYPPTYEIARAIEHYRKHKKFPIPSLLKTKFYYWQEDIGEVDTDEGKDIEMDSFTGVILCDSKGKELQKYKFRGDLGKMQVLKTPNTKAVH